MNVDYMVDQETGQVRELRTPPAVLAPGKEFGEHRHRRCLGLCGSRIGDCPFFGCPVLGLYERPAASLPTKRCLH